LPSRPALHQTKALLQTLPGFGAITVAKVIAHLPEEIIRASSDRTAATRLQAFMGNVHQSFFEYANQSVLHCAWAKLFLQEQIAKGKKHPTAVRALAFQMAPKAFGAGATASLMTKPPTSKVSNDAAHPSPTNSNSPSPKPPEAAINNLTQNA